MLLSKEVWVKQEFPYLVLGLFRGQRVCLHLIPVLLELREPDLAGVSISDLDHL